MIKTIGTISLTIILLAFPRICNAAANYTTLLVEVGTTNVALPPNNNAATNGINVIISNFSNLRNEIEIMYPLIQQQKVKLDIYDTRGSLVRGLLNTTQEPGLNRTNWDGLNNHGDRVCRGLYLMVLDRQGQRNTTKIMLAK